MTSTTRIQVGRRIRARRIARRLSQGQIGRRAGLNPSYVSRIEGGKVNPTVRTLAAVAEALGMPVAELIGPPRPNQGLIPCPVSSSGRCLCELVEQSPRRAAGDDESFTPAQIQVLRMFAAVVRKTAPETLTALRTLLTCLQVRPVDG